MLLPSLTAQKKRLAPHLGLKKPKIRSGEIGIFERKLVYDFVLDKGLHRYRVIVDAFSGKVREFEELSK